MKNMILLAACMALTATPVLADTAAEINIALTHAGFAAKGADLKTVQMHLHHTVNCLVGPGGEGFDPSNANPCAKAGNGAIPNSTDPAQKAKLQAAVADASKGFSATDVAAAQEAARTTADALAAAK